MIHNAACGSCRPETPPPCVSFCLPPIGDVMNNVFTTHFAVTEPDIPTVGNGSRKNVWAMCR